MNKILIVDASASDGRIMAGLLTRAGYDPVVTDCIEAGKDKGGDILNDNSPDLFTRCYLRWNRL